MVYTAAEDLPGPGEQPAWYKLGSAHGVIKIEPDITQPPPRKWYQYPAWDPGWGVVIGSFAVGVAALGFAIAAFALALMVFLRMH